MHQKSEGSEILSRRIFVYLLQREWNKRELSKEATFLIYSYEWWCEQRGSDGEVPVCSSLFRRDSSPLCTSADLFFFLHKPNNLFLCKAVHPFEIFHTSRPLMQLYFMARRRLRLLQYFRWICVTASNGEHEGRGFAEHLEVLSTWWSPTCMTTHPTSRR